MLFTIAIQNGATTTTDIAVRDLRDGTQTLVVRGGSDATSGGGGLNLWWRSADGNGAPERLTNTTNFQNPSGISPDGQRIVLHEATSSGIHIFQLTLDAEHRQTQLVTAGSGGVVSPDGRWLAFGSALSGRGEVYVRPYPNTEAGLWQITTTGARGPVWSRDGKELFVYDTSTKALMRVAVEAPVGGAWKAVAPQKLFDLSAYGVEELDRTRARVVRLSPISTRCRVRGRTLRRLFARSTTPSRAWHGWIPGGRRSSSSGSSEGSLLKRPLRHSGCRPKP